MSRKIYITIPLNVIVRVDEGVSITQLQDDIIVSAVLEGDTYSKADIEDIFVGPFQINDSK